MEINMKKLSWLAAGVLLLTVCGCATTQQTAQKMELEMAKSSVITYPSQMRGTYLFKSDENMRICSEPVPDVAMDALAKFSASLKETAASGLSIEPTLAYEMNVKAVELAGRTQLVLLAREMMFRACELSLNNRDNETAKKMFDKIVDVIDKMATTDQTKADAAKTNAEKDKLDAIVKAKKETGIVFDGGKK
jgi:hypothetical protein